MVYVPCSYSLDRPLIMDNLRAYNLTGCFFLENRGERLPGDCSQVTCVTVCTITLFVYMVMLMKINFSHPSLNM